MGGDIRAFSWYSHCFLFQGREYIRELGVYDYRYRFYNPVLGRFLQTDPIGFVAGDMNLFRYCGDDPVDGSDPSGLLDANLPNGWYAQSPDGTIYKPDQDNFGPDATGTTDRIIAELPKEPGTSWAPGDRRPNDHGASGARRQLENPYQESKVFYNEMGKGFNGPALKQTAEVIETAATVYVVGSVVVMVAVEAGAGAALAPVRLDGPGRGGRIAQIRYGSIPLLRLDYHKIPGSGGAPRLHLNLGPGKGKNSIHIPIDPRSWGD